MPDLDPTDRAIAEEAPIRSYLRLVKQTPVLARSEEERHTRTLWDERRRLTRQLFELPEPFRTSALEELAFDGPPDEPLLQRQIEICWLRLAMSGAEGVLERFSEMQATKRALDTARNALISANLRLVTFAARRYRTAGVSMMDLVQEGNLGLMEAVDRFRPDRGTRLSTYAVWWIRQRMNRTVILRRPLIRIPGHIAERIRDVAHVTRDLSLVLQRPPTEAEVAREAGLSSKQLARVREAPRLHESAVSHEGEPRDPLDAVADEAAPSPLQQTIDRDASERIAASLDRLSPRLQLTVRLRFGLDDDRAHTLREIGTALGISRERARQLLVEALGKILGDQLGQPRKAIRTRPGRPVRRITR